MASMTVSTYPTLPRILPTRAEVYEMLRHPAVACMAIVGATLVLMSFVGAVTFLAYSGKSPEALGFIVITPLFGLLTAVLINVRHVKDQTNGTQTRLLDAALTQTSTTPREGL